MEIQQPLLSHRRRPPVLVHAIPLGLGHLGDLGLGGGGAGTTWLVGSAADVASSLRKYRELGITHFVLSDTPYLPEIRRQGDQLLPLLRQ